MGHGADQHVDVGTSDSMGSTEIEEPRCLDIVARKVLEVAKSRELFVESFEDLVAADAGQNFLLHWPGQQGSPRGDEVCPLCDEPLFRRSELVGTPPQRERPDGGVDKDGHWGLRSRNRFAS